jgi:hypothetical protein
MSARPLLSVPAVRMFGMGERRPLRRIGDPVVAAAPAGVRIRTRLHLTEAEAAVVAGIGSFLGSVFRAELAGRVKLGRLDRASHAVWRAQRKQAVTAVSSSRWAGAITRAVEDQYQLGMRALSAHVADLQRAVDVLEQRCALRPGEQDPLPAKPRAVVVVVTDRPMSGSPRLAGSRCYGPDWLPPRTLWPPGGRRSPWAENVCGATVPTSMRRE